MKRNIIKEKTFDFGKKMVVLGKKLEEVNEYVLSKQIKRSGTAPGALVRESEHAESRKDFIHKLSIALKEANETDYWLKMLLAGDYISQNEHDIYSKQCEEIIRIIVKIIKTSKGL